MAYQALLFCPEDKTARTVTQVLSELEFNVEPCTEPFAAVKKLMSQHFDAVVVDCDNEQNATLLFKSARNSTSNQASLAVAIVEGQAGVAKAFRIGANLVLTKPINVEQSKGTLRVARGLLRKGESPKPPAATTPVPTAAAVPAAPPVPKPAPTMTAAVTPPTAAAPARPVTPKPVAPVKPQAPAAPVTVSTPRPMPAPVAKPTANVAPVRAAVATAKTAPEVQSEIAASKTVKSPVVPAAAAPAAQTAPAAVPSVTAAAPVAPNKPIIPPAAAKLPEATLSAPPSRPVFLGAPEGPVPAFGSGAASAPAPAREVPPSQAVPTAQTVQEPRSAPAPASGTPHAAEELLEKPVEATREKAIVSAPLKTETAPSFTFGGANVAEESSGARKKIMLGAAVLLLAVVGYFAWNHFQSLMKRANPTAAPAAVNSAPQPSMAAAPAPEKPSSPSLTTSQPQVPPAAQNAQSEPASQNNEPATEGSPSTQPLPSKPAPSVPAASKPTAAAKPAVEPLIVKGGSAPVFDQAPPASDSSAPSVAEIPTTGSDGALSNLVSGNGTGPQPVLQTINISQGVSQGLLLKKVQPMYPRSALAMRIEGNVELVATVSKTGAITSVKVIKGEQQLSRAAVDAVKQWKYKPYLLNGDPVEIQTQVTVVFKLPQ